MEFFFLGNTQWYLGLKRFAGSSLQTHGSKKANRVCTCTCLERETDTEIEKENRNDKADGPTYKQLLKLGKPRMGVLCTILVTLL